MRTVRDLIREIIQTKGLEMKDLSLKMDRGHSYLFEYLNKNKPRKLDEDDRAILARLLGVSESVLKEAPKVNPQMMPIGSVRKRAFNRSKANVTNDSPDQLRVLGMAEGGPKGWNILNGETVQMIDRPHILKGVPGAYAVYVSGHSMEPRYEAGEILYVHPGRVVLPGAYVVVQKRSSDGEPPLAVVKRLVRRAGGQVILAQTNPKKTIIVPASEVLSIHKIVGSTEA